MRLRDRLHRIAVLIVVRLLIGRVPKVRILPRDYSDEEISRSKYTEDFINWYWSKK